MKTRKEERRRVFVIFLLCCSCMGGFWSKKIAEVPVAVPSFPAINIRDADKFLNDLKLSPYWKVEKRSGTYLAIARSVGSSDLTDEGGGKFLFELMAGDKPKLSGNQIINNSDLHGNSNVFTGLSIEVIFRKPSDSEICFGSGGKNITLRIYDLLDRKIGLNSYSLLGIKLSDKADIYLILREQGIDKSRKTTLQKLPNAIREIKRIAELPAKYRVDVIYKPFLTMLFPQPFKEHGLGRFPGLQDRDTFYGYFTTKANTRYEGINLKISHPVYCPDEGTRRSSRLEKAEYSGRPYFEGDMVFFLIEDNAVYLPDPYNAQFGIFSGKGSFEGTLKVLNNEGVVLLKTTEKFKGWER